MITVQREALASALKTLKPSCHEKIALTCDSDGKLTLHSDGHLKAHWVSSRLPFVGQSLPSLAVSVGIVPLLARMTADTVQLSLQGTRLVIQADGRASIPAEIEPVWNWPELPKDEGLANIDPAELQQSLAWASLAMSDEAMRPQLCGVHMHPVGSMDATDGHRAHRSWVRWMLGLPEVTLPGETVSAWLRVLPSAKFAAITKRWDLVINEGATVIHTQTIDAEFPNINAIWPDYDAEGLPEIELPATLKDTLGRARQIDAAFVGVTLEPGQIAKRTHNGEYIEEVPLALPEGVAIGVNSDYLADALGPNARLQVKTGNDPILVRNDLGTAVIMPMRL